METTNVYPSQNAIADERRRFAIIRNKETEQLDEKFVFDITDFIDPDAEIDGKINTDLRITVDTIRSDLL